MSNQTTCPICRRLYNADAYQCKNCGIYIASLEEKFTDFSKKTVFWRKNPEDGTMIYPGVYACKRLLGKGEKPLILGTANYMTGSNAAGGLLLLTNKSLSFSAHAVNVGRLTERIELDRITYVQLGKNFLISQQILVTANGEVHTFVVNNGKLWVQHIQNAIAHCK